MQAGDRVAMLSLNSDRYLEYQMAVPWGGGVLNPCNIRWSAAEILYSLDDSGSTHPAGRRDLPPDGRAVSPRLEHLREVVYCGDGDVPSGMHGYEALLAEADPVPDALRRGDDLAGIFYTGGTTGFPKGVMLSHTNMCSSGLALRAEGLATSGGTYLHAAPMFHLADMGAGDGALDRGQHALDHPGVQPRARARHPRTRPRHPCAPGADHDPDDDRSPGDEEAARPERAADHRLRRLADL